jgi:tetratricopeptide (TPR) repeat protein
MNRLLTKALLFPALFLFSLAHLPAQVDGRFSEKQVKEQELFIEANKFRLLGNLEKASELLRELLQKDRKNHAAAYELARILADQNDNREALNLARQATSIEPQNVWYQRFLADMYQRNNMYQDAADIYETLVAQSPTDEYNYLKWAYFLVQAGQPKKALDVYNQLETRIGINEELSRRKHTLHLGTGNTELAGQELLRLCEAFPGNTDYLHLLAGFYRQTDQTDAARRTYEEILRLQPDDSKAFFALSSMDSPQSGELAFLQSLDPVFSNPQVALDEKIKPILPLVEKAAATNDEALARELLRLAAILDRVHPGEAKVSALNGDLLYLTGDSEKALDRYRQAVELDPGNYSVWEQLFRLALETRDYISLVFYTEKAMDVYPNQAMVYFYNGLGYSRQEKFSESIPSLEQAVLMTGRNAGLKAQVLTHLGIAYQYAGNAARCDQIFQQALQLAAENPIVLDGYAFALAIRGEKLDEALELIRKADQLAPENARIEATYAWVLSRQKEFEQAARWFEKALQHGGNQDPVTLEHFGDLKFQTEAVDEAVSYWQKAFELGFPSPRLQKKIADRKLYE